MKKILSISLVAAFAVLPLAAHATEGLDVQPTHTNNATTPDQISSNAPLFDTKTEHASDAYAASAGFVKGAYNASIRATNKVYELTKNSAGNGLTKNAETGRYDAALTSNGGLQLNGDTDGSKTIGIDTGDGITTDANGVKVNLTASNSGLELTGTAGSQTLQVDAGNGITNTANGVAVNLTSAGGLEMTGTDGAQTLGVKVDNSTVKINQNGQLYAEQQDLSSYATKTGVENTIKAATLTVGDFTLTSGAVSGAGELTILDTWDSTTPTTLSVAAGTFAVGTAITEGTVEINDSTVSYTETAPSQS